MIFENFLKYNPRQLLMGLLFALLCGTQGMAQTIPMAFLRNQMNTVVLTSGTSWTVPSGVTNLISVECWGAGGGAAGPSTWSAYGGGGGGAYAKKNNLAVTPGNNISYSIGAAGASGNNSNGINGGDTWFLSTSTVKAQGGRGSLQDGTNYLGGAGGATASCVGDVLYAGGNGGDNPSYYPGVGGGASGSPTGAGANGLNPPSNLVGAAGGAANGGGAGGAAGTSGASPTVGVAGTSNQNGGGGGGGGGAGSGVAGAAGGAGGFPGGGAGASGGSSGTGGAVSGSAAGGQIILTYRR